MILRIINKAKYPYCLFCKNKLIGDNFVEIDSQLISGSKTNRQRFKYPIHLTCGYKFLKKIRKPDKETGKMITLLECNYMKEILCESLSMEKAK